MRCTGRGCCCGCGASGGLVLLVLLAMLLFGGWGEESEPVEALSEDGGGLGADCLEQGEGYLGAVARPILAQTAPLFETARPDQVLAALRQLDDARIEELRAELEAAVPPDCLAGYHEQLGAHADWVAAQAARADAEGIGPSDWTGIAGAMPGYVLAERERYAMLSGAIEQAERED